MQTEIQSEKPKTPPLSKCWLEHLEQEFQKDYMKQLKLFLSGEIKKGKTIYPHASNFFRALELTPLSLVKVVIIGQDPYHGPDQAHGLSFSVNKGIKIPPSLQNIYKELKTDLNIEIPAHGFLESWAQQGILLLNNVLSVEASKAASHQKKGWELFTDKVVEVLNSQREHLVFILWGSHAQKKGAAIDINKHLILKSPHPSPLSAHRGFFGCKHFSKTNNYLKAHNQDPIDWKIS